MFQKIPTDISVLLKYLHQKKNVKCSELAITFPKYAPRSIYRHAKKPLGETVHDKRHYNKGRPRKLLLLRNGYKRKLI